MLRGKVHFFKITVPLVKTGSDWVRGAASRDNLDWALKRVREDLLQASPKILRNISTPSPPVRVFLDGACEEGVCTIGAVMFAPNGKCLGFGAEVGQDLVEEWKSSPEQVQVIGQAEIFPPVVARLT